MSSLQPKKSPPEHSFLYPYILAPFLVSKLYLLTETELTLTFPNCFCLFVKGMKPVTSQLLETVATATADGQDTLIKWHL